MIQHGALGSISRIQISFHGSNSKAIQVFEIIEFRADPVALKSRINGRPFLRIANQQRVHQSFC